MEDLTGIAGQAWAAAEARYNMNHLGPGPGGGEFTTAADAGKSSGVAAQHNAAHNAGQVAHEAGQDKKQAAGLRERANDDRKKAHQLQAQLHQLEQQIASTTAAAKKTAAASKAAAKKTVKKPASPHKTAVKHMTSTQKTRALQHQANQLRTEIKTLLAQANSLDQQAKQV